MYVGINASGSCVLPSLFPPNSLAILGRVERLPVLPVRLFYLRSIDRPSALPREDGRLH